jgi:D-alanyl-D-alanine carboxypeptidase
MTALVALDHWDNLETVIEVKNEDRAVGQTIELKKGEQLTLRNMLYGLLVQSANDAALALADNYPGGYSEFVRAMNAKAKELHLDHTVYKNPSGVEQYGHVTTARDLAILAGIAIRNPVIAQIVKTRATSVTDITGTTVHELETTNELLGVLPGIKGLKTGWTTNAGECLVSIIERDGHEIVVVVLGSLDRFGETTRLVEWVYGHHNWLIPEL